MLPIALKPQVGGRLALTMLQALHLTVFQAAQFQNRTISLGKT